MAERRFIERLTDAVTELRDPIPSKTLGDIRIEKKSSDTRPDFGRDNYYQWNAPQWYRGWGNYSKINYTSELGNLSGSSLVMAVVNWTGINLAEALPVVTKPDTKNVPQVQLQHEASDLVRRPNPFFIWADYCLAGAFSWWMGNWYMKKVRNISGQVVELWYLPHFLVHPRWPYDGKSPEVPLSEVEGDPRQAFISHYQYDQPGKTPVLIKKADMIHIKRGVNPDNPRVGVGVWDGVLEELYGDQAVARFSAALMKNMGILRYFLSPKDKDVTIDATTRHKMKEEFVQATSGDNAGAPVVGSGAMDVSKLTADPKDLDLGALRNVPESRIAGVTGIPAIVLQFMTGLEHGHYGAAYEQARQQGYENVIIPIQNHISEDLTWQLLPEIDKTAGAKIAFDITKVRVLQEDRDALYKRESEALSAGGITINQFLQSIGKEPIKEGDVYLVPSTSTPMTAEKLLERANSDPQPAPQAQPIDPQTLKMFADQERMFEAMESQMKEFMQSQPPRK